MRKSIAKILFRISYLIAGKNYHSNIFCLPGEHLGQAIIKDGSYESGVIKSVKEFVSKKNQQNSDIHLVDVGANIGTHTVGFADIYKSAVSYEPNPIISNLLEVNISINKIKNVTVRKIALSDIRQNMILNVPQENHGNASLQKMHSDESFELQTSTIDNELLGKYSSGNLILLKIDVEGHELEVIKGGKEFLLKHNVIIVLEHTKSHKTEKLYNLLEDIDYKAKYQVDTPRFSTNPLYRLMSLFGLLREEIEGPFNSAAEYVPAVIFCKD
tara:strand:- start:231 stop:1043 length:813 start_codon:yes stop_codon:yes gene_type:complete